MKKFLSLSLLLVGALLVSGTAGRVAMAEQETNKKVVASQSKEQILADLPYSDPRDLDLLAVGKVKEVMKSDMIRLSGKDDLYGIRLGDDQIYRIGGIRVPLFYKKEVIALLEKLLVGREVGLYTLNSMNEKNKEKVIPVHILREDGMWIEEELVKQGLAWASSTPNDRLLVRALYASEQKARADNVGMWADENYSLKSNKTIAQYVNTYQVYQGRVLDASYQSDRYYFNFGTDWKSDFTMVIHKKYKPVFTPEGSEFGFNYKALVGKRVRVRGWVEKNGGPAINLETPEQIEILD